LYVQETNNDISFRCCSSYSYLKNLTCRVACVLFKDTKIVSNSQPFACDEHSYLNCICLQETPQVEFWCFLGWFFGLRARGHALWFAFSISFRLTPRPITKTERMRTHRASACSIWATGLVKLNPWNVGFWLDNNLHGKRTCNGPYNVGKWRESAQCTYSHPCHGNMIKSLWSHELVGGGPQWKGAIGGIQKCLWPLFHGTSP
jgi:hypothetical protein